MSFSTVEERRAYFRARYHRLRKEWFDANGPCRRCGSWYRLQLDHIDPTDNKTGDDNTRLWNWGEVKRQEELSKCQALCQECHWEKTAEDRRKRRGDTRVARRS